MEALNIADIAKAEREFTTLLGQALIQWGVIEQRLCFWFVTLTGMPDAMGRSIFYAGVTSFDPRARMLKLAARHCNGTEGLKKFVITTTNKASNYSITRNRLSHCETKYDFNPKSSTYGQMIFVEGSQPLDNMTAALTAKELPTITQNYRELSKIIMDVYQDMNRLDEASLRKFREQVHALPPQAHDTKPNPNSLEG